MRIAIIGRDKEGYFSQNNFLSPNLLFTGFLSPKSEYIRYIDHADVCLLPFPKHAVAGGARNKALDYFSRKKIVISTEEGIRGLDDFENGKHLIVDGYSAVEFAERILEVVSHKYMYDNLAENAFSLVSQKFTWDIIAKNVLAFFESSIEVA